MLISNILIHAQARITGRLKPMLEHPDGEVRARACNVVGNLCRYNTAFYEPILEAGLIEVLIDRCRDFDRGTRKFATFAIGNAGAPLPSNCKPRTRLIYYAESLLSQPASNQKPGTCLVGGVASRLPGGVEV